MNLKTYFEQFPFGARGKEKQRVASLVGVGVDALQHWVNGRRKPTPNHVFKLEKVLDFAVTRYELRPDIYPLGDKAA